jgi:aspartyl-tRNA(Asn)/glutamyl-tRNA(Gln) amidotransferase subunit B
MEFEAVIGLEVHAELETKSKMFCACPVVDSTQVEPNIAVCPVCAGMPGVLPVVNQKAVEYAVRVALALDCEIAHTSIFARKNYFYPDLPKGYQISQYEQPLAVNGKLKVHTSQGERTIRIRRVHLEEDTGKLTHVNGDDPEDEAHSLVDLNRAGISLLEIVSEPDLHTAEEVRAYAMALRSLLRYLGVNSGDMQKGIMRIEPNVSVRLVGSQELGTRTEIKNLNSFRVLENSVAFEIERQSERLRQGLSVIQETMGWDESQATTVPQRSKEEAHDYRYFPEPDIPPLEIAPDWIETLRARVPELPRAKKRRLIDEYGIRPYDAALLVGDRRVADYFEAAAGIARAQDVAPQDVANWVSGELFRILNASATPIDACKTSPERLAALLVLVQEGTVSVTAAKTALGAMCETGEAPEDVVRRLGLTQISDTDALAALVDAALAAHPEQVQQYLDGKMNILGWLVGQVMRASKGKANPQDTRTLLQQALERERLHRS